MIVIHQNPDIRINCWKCEKGDMIAVRKYQNLDSEIGFILECDSCDAEATLKLRINTERYKG